MAESLRFNKNIGSNCLCIIYPALPRVGPRCDPYISAVVRLDIDAWIIHGIFINLPKIKSLYVYQKMHLKSIMNTLVLLSEIYF